MENNFKVFVEMTAEDLAAYQEFLATKDNKKEVTVKDFSTDDLIDEIKLRGSDKEFTEIFEPTGAVQKVQIRGYLETKKGVVKFVFIEDASTDFLKGYRY